MSTKTNSKNTTVEIEDVDTAPVETPTEETTAQDTREDINQHLTDEVRKMVGDEPLSAYKFAKVWSDVVGRDIRPQMAYNYKAKGMIKVNEDGLITPEFATEFLVKRLTKQVS